MSVDTTVVIAARRLRDGELEYTAKCVQAVQDLFDPDPTIALDAARSFFGVPGLQWFRGSRGLGRAKELAHLISDDLKERGDLEYHHVPIIEITNYGVSQLTRKGKRKEDIAPKEGGSWINDPAHQRFSRHVHHSVTETRSVTESDGRRSVRGGRSVIHSVTGSGLQKHADGRDFEFPD